MALPQKIVLASPADLDNPSSGAAEIRALKQFLIDVLGLTNNTNYTASGMSIAPNGTVVLPAGSAGALPAYPYASLPTPATAGLLARVTDNIGGVWMDGGAGKAWRPIAPFIDVTQPPFNATGNGITDDSAAIQAAIDASRLGLTTSQVPVILPALGSQATTLYLVSNLTVYSGTRLIGMGSHRTILQQKTGATGNVIADDGTTAIKIRLEGFELIGNGVAGNGIWLVGNGSSTPWGSEGSLDDVYVTGFTNGTGITVSANGSFMRYVRSMASSVGFDIRGGVLVGSQILASNNGINFKILGTGHRFQSVYSESATTEHIVFGDGATSTTRNTFDGVQFHIAAGTTNLVHVYAMAGNPPQLNQVVNGTYDYAAGGTLTNYVLDASSGVTLPVIDTSNTFAGKFEYTPDLRGTKVKVLVEADFTAHVYAPSTYSPYTTFIVESTTAASTINLPAIAHSQGRIYQFRNNSGNRLRLAAGAAIFYPPYSDVAVTNYDIPPGDTVIVAGDLNGHWQAIGAAAVMQASKTWDPGSCASGTPVTTTIAVTDSLLGDYVDASLDVSLGGLQLSGYVSVNGTVTAMLVNPTGTPVDLASSTLRVRVRRQ